MGHRNSRCARQFAQNLNNRRAIDGAQEGNEGVGNVDEKRKATNKSSAYTFEISTPVMACTDGGNWASKRETSPESPVDGRSSPSRRISRVLLRGADTSNAT